MKRIGVTGGRHFADRDLVAGFLADLPADATLIHGAASGADRLAAEWWESAGRTAEPHPAPWSAPCRSSCAPEHRRPRDGGSYCPAAGVYRNQEMVDSGLDLLVAFPGERGTADMIRRAGAAGVRVIRASKG